MPYAATMTDFLQNARHADRVRQIERMRSVFVGERQYTVVHGNSRSVLRALPSCSVDSVVTDPPAGIGFMGKKWDEFGKVSQRSVNAAKNKKGLLPHYGRGGTQQSRIAYKTRARDGFVAYMSQILCEAWRVLKPGGYALVWALPKTSHWTATACENAGFEIVDRVSHFFGSGFPKNLSISKAIDKAHDKLHKRKVIGKTNRNISAAQGRGSFGGQRAFREKNWHVSNLLTAPATDAAAEWEGFGTALKPACEDWWLVRKPLQGTYVDNVLTHGTGALNIDGCRIHDGVVGANLGITRSSKTKMQNAQAESIARTNEMGRWPANIVFDEAAAAELDRQAPVSRFFYAAKPSRREKEEGLLHLPTHSAAEATGSKEGQERLKSPRTGAGRSAKSGVRNHHPTVKSIALMRWLCRLITPPGGVVVDAFNGSGTTGCAAVLEGFRYIGIDAELPYVRISRARIRKWATDEEARWITAKEASMRVVRG